LSSEGGNLRRRHHSYERQIEPREERVLLDVGGAALRPKPAVRVLVEQPGDEVPRVHFKRGGGRGGGKGEGVFNDVAQRSLVRWAREGCATVHHLEDKYPEGPPVDGVAVGVSGGDFR